MQICYLYGGHLTLIIFHFLVSRFYSLNVSSVQRSLSLLLTHIFYWAKLLDINGLFHCLQGGSILVLLLLFLQWRWFLALMRANRLLIGNFVMHFFEKRYKALSISQIAAYLEVSLNRDWYVAFMMSNIWLLTTVQSNQLRTSSAFVLLKNL